MVDRVTAWTTASTPILHTTKWSRSGSFSRLRQQQRPPMQRWPPFKQHLWPRKLRLPIQQHHHQTPHQQRKHNKHAFAHEQAQPHQEDRATHDIERTDGTSSAGQDTVVQQLITALGRMGTTPKQGSTVSTYSQGSREEFTGNRGEDEPTMFMVRFESLFRSMELEDAFCRTVPIKVGMLSREELYGQFHRREVDAAYRAWKLLLNSVVDVAMMVRMTAEGSTSGGWSAFKSYYTPQADAEKERA
ncbi:unnamed protein product [Pylaiella littoralis]